MADIPFFDFKEYIDSYSGRDRLLRIHHMVKRGLLDEADALIGLRMAFEELTNGTPNWRLATDYKFLEIVSTLINERLGPNYIATPEIRKQMKSLYNQELYYKRSALKYAVECARNEKEQAKIQDRMEDPTKQANVENFTHLLGQYQYRSGRPKEAFDTLSELPTSIVLMLSAIECRKFEAASYLAIQRDRYTPAIGGDDMKGSDFKRICVRGLANMATGYGLATDDYHAAACSFAHLIKFYVRWSNYTFELFTWDDLYMYCTWCGMATMTREELRDIAKDMETHRVGSAFQHLIRDYLEGNFASCLAFLETELKPKAILDLYLCEHVNSLSNLIRDKLTVELVTCFSSVKVKSLKEKLGITDIWRHLDKMFYNNDLEDYTFEYDETSQETFLMRHGVALAPMEGDVEVAPMEEDQESLVLFASQQDYTFLYDETSDPEAAPMEEDQEAAPN